jgi:hypothetical protein
MNRRHRTLRAKDGGTDMRISIVIDFENGCYSRDEREAAIESATSQVMQIIPGMRFVAVPLSRVKVTR